MTPIVKIIGTIWLILAVMAYTIYNYTTEKPTVRTLWFSWRGCTR